MPHSSRCPAAKLSMEANQAQASGFIPQTLALPAHQAGAAAPSRRNRGARPKQLQRDAGMAAEVLMVV